MEVEVHIVNAFTQNQRGGNPAAIVLNGQGYNTPQKQEIARLVGLSETTFISPSSVADFKLDFFTPTRQIAHCGHATIASFAYLKQLGILTDVSESSKETIDGVRKIKLADNEIYMQQERPVFTRLHEQDIKDVYCSLSLEPSHRTPLLVYTGNRFLILQVENISILKGIKPDLDLIAKISQKYDLIGFYIFAIGDDEAIDATARMFGPAYGIAEESATGMAAGPLAAYLYQQGYTKDSFLIEQGKYMPYPSPSLIKVRLALVDDEISTLYAGGTATFIEKRIITLEQ